MMPINSTPQPSVRWRLSRAFLYGLALQAFALLMSGLADGGKDFALWRQGTVAEQISGTSARGLKL
jgi:hypothetical protein